jgi:hypothetical protein
MARIYNQNPTKVERNQQIWERYASGTAVSDIAATFGLSEQRVYEILNQVKTSIPAEDRDQVAKMRRAFIDKMRERVAEIMMQPAKRAYAPNGKELPEFDHSEILAAVDRGIKLDERLARLTGTDAVQSQIAVSSEPSAQERLDAFAIVRQLRERQAAAGRN